MITSVRALIDRARVYIDDDHNETPGWLSDQAWLDLFNVEYGEQYRTWFRLGLATPPPVDVTFTGEAGDATLPVDSNDPGVLSIIEVVEDTGSSYRVLPPASSMFGKRPIHYTQNGTGKATSWEMQLNGFSDGVVVILNPPGVTGNYIVRYVPQATPIEIADIDATMLFPDGMDERIVLGMARRAKLKEGSASALLERLIMQADADIRMVAFGRANGDSPRVRSNRGYFLKAGLYPQPVPDRYGV